MRKYFYSLKLNKYAIFEGTWVKNSKLNKETQNEVFEGTITTGIIQNEQMIEESKYTGVWNDIENLKGYGFS